MTEFGLDKRITSDVCDQMYLIGRLLSQAHQAAAEVSNDLRRHSGLYEVSVLLNKEVGRLDELTSCVYNMGNILSDSLMLYIKCENHICEKYIEKSYKNRG